jgi:hypothetical protein
MTISAGIGDGYRAGTISSAQKILKFSASG